MAAATATLQIELICTVTSLAYVSFPLQASQTLLIADTYTESIEVTQTPACGEAVSYSIVDPSSLAPWASLDTVSVPPTVTLYTTDLLEATGSPVTV